MSLEPEDITVQNFNDIEVINNGLSLAFKLKQVLNEVIGLLNQSLDKHSEALLSLKPGTELSRKTEEMILYEERELEKLNNHLDKLNCEIDAFIDARDLIISIDMVDDQF